LDKSLQEKELGNNRQIQVAVGLQVIIFFEPIFFKKMSGEAGIRNGSFIV